MKRIILVVLLVSIAAFAGIVRSYSKTGRSISELPRVVSGDSDSQGDVRDEIRKSFELAVSERMILVWRFEGDLKAGPCNEGGKNIAG